MLGLAHPSDKNKDVAQIHPTNEDLFVGTRDLGHPYSCGLKQNCRP